MSAALAKSSCCVMEVRFPADWCLRVRFFSPPLPVSSPRLDTLEEGREGEERGEEGREGEWRGEGVLGEEKGRR